MRISDWSSDVCSSDLLTLSKGNFGLFVRGSYLFNQRLNDHDFFNPDNYYTPGAFDPGYGTAPSGNVSVAPSSEYSHKTRKVRDYPGNDADLLATYVHGTLALGDRDLAVKPCRQVSHCG